MYCSSQVISQFRLVVFLCRGRVSPPHILRAWSAYTESCNYDQTFATLVDLEGFEAVDCNFTSTALLVQRLPGFRDNWEKGVLTTIFAPDDETFGIGRMFQSASARGHASDVRVCRTRTDALSSLGYASEHPDTAALILEWDRVRGSAHF